MLIIPAIDLLDGECVRLFRGDYSRATRYAKDPAAVARRFEEAGARLIHIVDLNRARGDTDGNREAIRAVRKSVSCALEVGGGVRSGEDVAELLAIGVERIIIGTALVKDPDNVTRWIAEQAFYPIAGLDAKNREVKIQGWTDGASIRDTAIARGLSGMGFREIIYTNISRDGTLAGPDLESTNEIAEATGLPVILSGGIGSPEDVAAVAARKHPGIKGTIVGKALYEEKVSLSALIVLYQKDEDSINE